MTLRECETSFLPIRWLKSAYRVEHVIAQDSVFSLRADMEEFIQSSFDRWNLLETNLKP